MNQPKKKPSLQSKSAAARTIESTIHPPYPSPVSNGVNFRQTTQVYHEGPFPHPEILEGMDKIVPGAAERIIKMAEDESAHRRAIENRVTDANINAQKVNLETVAYQSKSVFQSDLIGQGAGICVSVLCVLGAVYLSINNHETVAVALAAIPTAAVIQAFFAKRPKTSSKENSADKTSTIKA